MNEAEAKEAIIGGADIIDVKNPVEGSLGANYPWVITKIRQLTPKHFPLSCTIGDVPNLPGTISLAALGAATLEVDYIKLGLYGTETPQEAIFLLKQVRKTVKTFNPNIKIAAAGYADAQKIGSVNPLKIPEIAKEAAIDIAMIDTAVKDGKTLFDHLTHKQLETFVKKTHELGLQAALAGSLKKHHLEPIFSLGTDIVGLRGAACTKGDRNTGVITQQLVKELAEIIVQLKRL